MNVALILIKEPAENAARFIGAISNEWESTKITELIGCLDCILDWEESYFQEFTMTLMQQLFSKCEHGQAGQALLKQLTMMYEMNLAETNLRLVIIIIIFV